MRRRPSLRFRNIPWLLMSLTATGWATDERDYQVDLSVPAGQTPLQQIETRGEAILPHLACGRELKVLGDLARMKQDADFQPGEGHAAIVSAKMYWLLRHGDWRQRTLDEQLQPAGCQLTYRESIPSGAATEVMGLAQVQQGSTNALETAFGAECASSRVSVTAENDWHRVEVALSGPCLRRQLNVLLVNLRNNTQIGSEKVPCRLGLGGESSGDYDVVIRDLSRVFFDDASTGQAVLEAPARDHVRDQLLSISGPPMPDESYSFFECGNTEKYTGTPEDIAAEQGAQPFHVDVWDDLWPGIKWFLRRLVLVLLIATGAAAVAGALAAWSIPGAVVLLTAAGLASFVLTFGRIPETENHLLMIESSRFLKNRILIEYYDSNGMAADAAEFRNHQNAIRSWLLERLQDITEADFEEYNSRPYQRYSLIALMNLYDYSNDAQLRTAAQIVLDRQFAKYVVGSSENRRFAPFRRQMHRLKEEFDQPGADGVVDLGDSDFPAFMALAYVGDTTHLPGAIAPRGPTQELAATIMTGYRPPEMLIDLARQTQGGLNSAGDGIWQHRVRHDSNEIYVRGRHFAVVAGGAEASWVNQLEALGVKTGIALDANDRGAAFPTTLLLAAASATGGAPSNRRDRLWQQLRIHGPRNDHGDFWSYDRNLCVWKGFACGEDMRVPAELISIAQTGPSRNGGTWRFIDTSACPQCNSSRRVFVALFTDFATPTFDADGTAHIGRGFFEVLDAEDAGGDFNAFITGVSNRNATVGTVRGEYATARGERIYFDATAQRGIEMVNGAVQPDLEDWPSGIDGNVIVRRGLAQYEITNRRLGRKLVLDFYSPASPSRQELGCTPVPCSP